jgi:hypothetical protein
MAPITPAGGSRISYLLVRIRCKTGAGEKAAAKVRVRRNTRIGNGTDKPPKPHNLFSNTERNGGDLRIDNKVSK